MPHRVGLSRWSAAVIAASIVFLAGVNLAQAGQWPQILGPHRNGRADSERLADRWPSGGPPTLWRHEVGSGFAGVAVASGRVVLFHRVKDQEIAESLDATDGKPIWKTSFPARYVPTYNPDGGPRCVPVIHDGFVYLFGAAGDLHCLSARDGNRRWSRSLNEELRTPEGYFGVGSSPLVEGDRLLLNVGGRTNAGLVAIAISDGHTIWKATDERASYSSPVAASIDGVRHVIFATRYNLLSVDPDSGRVRWEIPFGQRGPTVNAATPLVLGDHVFVSASYGVGALLAKITPEGARTVWSNDKVMSSQYTTCVHKDGYMYGVDGRQDIGVARLRCFDPMTGRVHWTEEGIGMATLILADEKLLIIKTDGRLILAEASPKGYRQLAAARIFDATTRALPALSDGKLYVRDASVLKCLNVGAGD